MSSLKKMKMIICVRNVRLWKKYFYNYLKNWVWVLSLSLGLSLSLSLSLQQI